MNEFEKFLELVERMRTHQRDYLKNRQPFDLYDAKRFEKQVDEEIIRLKYEIHQTNRHCWLPAVEEQK